MRANGGGRQENDHGLVIQCPAQYKLEHSAEKAPRLKPRQIGGGELGGSEHCLPSRPRLPRLHTEEHQWNDQQSGSGRRPRRGRASKSQPAGQTAPLSQGQSSKCGRQSRDMNRMQPACVKPEAVSNSWSAVDTSSFVRPFSVSAAASGESCADAPGDEFLNGCKSPEHTDTHAPFPCQLPDKALTFRDWLLSFLGVAGRARNGLNHFIALSLKPIACKALPGPTPRDLWPCPPPRPWRRWTAPMNPSPRARRRHAHFRAVNLLLRQTVACLDWLTLGFPSEPPDKACVGAPCSHEQACMLNDLEEMISHFLKAEPFASEQLGRSESKFIGLINLAASLPEVIKSFTDSDLASLAQSLSANLTPYSRASKDRTPESKAEVVREAPATTTEDVENTGQSRKMSKPGVYGVAPLPKNLGYKQVEHLIRPLSSATLLCVQLSKILTHCAFKAHNGLSFRQLRYMEPETKSWHWQRSGTTSRPSA